MSNIQLITPEFRMSFPNLVVPKRYKEKGKETGEPFFNLEMLIDPQDMTKFKRWDEASQSLTDVDLSKVCVEVAKSAFPGINMKDEFKVGTNWPIHDGTALADKKEAEAAARGKNKDCGHYRDLKIIKAKTKEENPPRLYIREGGKNVQLAQAIEVQAAKAKQLFAGGNYAYAEISVAGTESAGRKYISFYVNSVVFTREGDRIGGSSLMDRFDGYASQTTDYDPTDGLDDLMGSDDDLPF